MVIVEMPPNKDWVTVSASISSIEKCFQTKLASWENSRSGLVRDDHVVHLYHRYVVVVVVVTADVVAATHPGLIFITLIIIVMV